MARGRRPKPTALKKLQGNPGRRPLNENEPVTRKLAAEPPEFLNDIAKAEWKRLYEETEAIGLIQITDLAVFAAYCQAFARWVEASQHVEKDGVIVLSKIKKYPQQNPYLAIANRAMKQMLDAASKLGFDPSSRSKISLPPKDKDDEW